MLDWRKRGPEWMAITKRYQQQRGPLPVWHLFKAILAGPVPRAVWRNRIMRHCKGCICFDQSINVDASGRKWRSNACAGPYGIGCGCQIPFLALSANPGRDGCWLHSVDKTQGGWPAYRFPSIWHRLWAPIGFLLGR